MSPADAGLAFTPHATSKIASVTDLEHVSTMGFRGEALASIAAVARVTLATKQQGRPLEPGTRIVIPGGKIISVTSVAGAEGTSILVEDLFYNTPARKKFQKSRNAELAHVHSLLEGIVLACPAIALSGSTITVQEKLLTDRDATLPETISRVYRQDPHTHSGHSHSTTRPDQRVHILTRTVTQGSVPYPHLHRPEYVRPLPSSMRLRKAIDLLAKDRFTGCFPFSYC